MQCKDLGIEIVSECEIAPEYFSSFDLIVDSMFGFSFNSSERIREPFAKIISVLSILTDVPIISIDVPSSWNVDTLTQLPAIAKFKPRALVSLTVPKTCSFNFDGVHYVGGRFVPPSIVSEFKLKVPEYGNNANQVVKLSSSPSPTESSIRHAGLLEEENDGRVRYFFNGN